MSAGRFEHSDVTGTLRALGGYDRLAENIYRGSLSYADSGSAHTAFMLSDEHRHTLLASAYTTAAVGVYCDASGELWVTVHFGAPTGHVVPIREVRLAAGAEFLVIVCGAIMTMPGLPRVPAANAICVNKEGQIEGLF